MSITDSSTLPNMAPRRCRLPMTAIRDMTMDRARVTLTSCPAALRASLGCSFPRYWAEITAPPVARAPMICMIRTLMESTRDTPDTAASPTAATITTSTIPTSTAMICSTIRGASSFISCFLENMLHLPYTTS